MNKIIGYHYTSYSNWISIDREGLIPHQIANINSDYVKRKISGTWLWKNKLLGESHAGTVIHRAISKSSMKIVLLEVIVDRENLLIPDDRKKNTLIEINHDGKIGDWNYHYSEKAWICVKKIPPKDIRVVKVFDLLELLEV